MSYNKICITDKDRAVSGELHGSMTDVLIAALTAEPETIEEYDLALRRFVEFETERMLLSDFAQHEDFEPYDAGIVAIDLAGRVIGCDSTYSSVSREDGVVVPKGFADSDDDPCIPYRIPTTGRSYIRFRSLKDGVRSGERSERRRLR